MSKITAYAALTAPVGSDVVPAVDVSDTTQSGSGTTKKLLLSDLAVFGGSLTGLQFQPVTATPTVPVVINATTITNAVIAGYVGLYLDPRQVWDMSGLVIAPASFPLLSSGLSNFRIKSAMTGSIGWTGNISYGAGYIKTDTGSPADGIQIYSDGSFETQGIIFEGCVFVGANTNAVVHLGGRQRRCVLWDSLIYNTNATRTTVAAGSNAVDVTTFVGSSTLNVASAASFPTSGNVVVATTLAMATIKYTGKSGTTLTGCTTLGGIGTLATGGTVGLAAFGLVVDTALFNANSENSEYLNLSIAGANCAFGMGINDLGQHFNDSQVPGLTTAAGLVALVAMNASNITFINYYDRSAPALVTVANHGGILTFVGGEAYNSGAAPHELVGSAAATVYMSRLLTAGTGTNTILIPAGRFHANQRTRLNGAAAISLSGALNCSDPSGNHSGFAVTGSSGTLLLSGQYLTGAGASPTVSGWSGTTHTSTWV